MNGTEIWSVTECPQQLSAAANCQNENSASIDQSAGPLTGKTLNRKTQPGINSSFPGDSPRSAAGVLNRRFALRAYFFSGFLRILPVMKVTHLPSSPCMDEVLIDKHHDAGDVVF